MNPLIIAYQQVGERIIKGTVHPVIDLVQRHQQPDGRFEWVFVLELCNGVPKSSTLYAKVDDALAQFRAREVLADAFERVQVRKREEAEWASFHPKADTSHEAARTGLRSRGRRRETLT